MVTCPFVVSGTLQIITSNKPDIQSDINNMKIDINQPLKRYQNYQN